MKIRSTQKSDIADLQTVLNRTELFPSEMLPDMIAGYLNDPETTEVWLTCEIEQSAVGFCYAIPEMLADGVWNMLAIAVLPQKQGDGCGHALVHALETELKKQNQRIVIADTSGAEAFAQTRAFYDKNGYTQEARIRDFWAEGDDKIVFWKSLN